MLEIGTNIELPSFDDANIIRGKVWKIHSDFLFKMNKEIRPVLRLNREKVLSWNKDHSRRLGVALGSSLNPTWLVVIRLKEKK